MINFLKLVGQVQGTYLYILKSGIIFSKTDDNTNFKLKANIQGNIWEVKFVSDTPLPSIIENDEYIIIYDGTVHFIDKNNGDKLGNFTYSINYLSSKCFIHSVSNQKNIGIKTYSCFSYDIKGFRLIWRLENVEYASFNIFDNFIFFKRETSLTCHAIIDGSELWRLDFRSLIDAENLQVQGEIIEHQRCLWFSIFDHKTFLTLCVEIETGKIIHQSEAFTDWFILANEKLYSIYFDTMNAVSPIIFDYQYLVKVLHPHTFELESIDISEALRTLGLRFGINKFSIDTRKFLVVGDELYFAQENVPEDQEDIIGIISLSTQQLLWHTKVSKYGTHSIQYHQNRLYVLDSEGTLHIFEREA